MDGEHWNGETGYPPARPTRHVPPPGPTNQAAPTQAAPTQVWPGPTNPAAPAQAWPGPADRLAPPPFPPQPLPDGPGGQERGRPDRAGPGRGVIAVSLSLAVVAAIGVGALVAKTRSTPVTTTQASSPAALTPPAGPTTSPTPTSAPPTTPATRPAASAPSATPSATATAVSHGKPPTAWQSEPWSYPGMDFGTVLAVTKQSSGAVITVRRQRFLTGDDAKAYYQEHTDLEEMDYAIVDVDAKPHRFTVTAKALIYGRYLLSDESAITTTQLTPTQFVTKARELLSTQIPLHVWLYHRTAPNGTVVYLAEQYTP